MEVIFLYALVLLIAVLVSGFAHRSVLSTAVIFLIAGFLLGQEILGVISFSEKDEVVSVFVELALFAVLFTDGMLIGLKDLRESWRLPGRALLLGMPLTFAITAVFAYLLLDLSWAEAFLIGAVLAPTDPVFSESRENKSNIEFTLVSSTLRRTKRSSSPETSKSTLSKWVTSASNRLLESPKAKILRSPWSTSKTIRALVALSKLSEKDSVINSLLDTSKPKFGAKMMNKITPVTKTTEIKLFNRGFLPPSMIRSGIDNDPAVNDVEETPRRIPSGPQPRPDVDNRGFPRRGWQADCIWPATLGGNLGG